jgi:hypothetical protein
VEVAKVQLFRVVDAEQEADGFAGLVLGLGDLVRLWLWRHDLDLERQGHHDGEDAAGYALGWGCFDSIQGSEKEKEKRETTC